MAKLVRIRNYKEEKSSGQMDLMDGLRIVKDERDSETFDILQLAQIFAFCSLPYRPTQDRQISHIARLGDGSMVEVVFTAMRPDVNIAYGNDRYLLYWLIDKAIREHTAFIPWEHASQYLKAMNQDESSGRNRELLRARFRRIASTAITVVRKTSTEEEQVIIPIIRRMRLPASISGVEKAPGIEMLERHKAGRLMQGVQFDEGFVEDFMAHRVPVLRSLVVATQARPQMQDCMFFLIWRSYSAASDSIISWDALRDQFWQADSNRSRIRSRFAEAISLIRTTWPELRAEATSRGLRVGPPQHGRQFVPQLKRPKHIEEAAAKQASAIKRSDAEMMVKKLFPSRSGPS